jgi:hypothetical protein
MYNIFIGFSFGFFAGIWLMDFSWKYDLRHRIGRPLAEDFPLGDMHD